MGESAFTLNVTIFLGAKLSNLVWTSSAGKVKIDVRVDVVWFDWLSGALLAIEGSEICDNSSLYGFLAGLLNRL